MQDGKFHPHTQYKNIRKSRDQSTKSQGVKIERNAREVIFQDDPDAIPKLEKKLEDLEKQRAYWKTVKKTIPRDYSATEGDRKWFMPQNINANIRTVKKKIEKIKERKEKGIGLERKTTFKDGRKVFYYEEVQPVGKVRKARESDSGEIPPEKIFNKERLTKHDGRYFLIAEGYPDTLAVDEYKKVNDNLFKLKRNILFSQSGEETEELLRVTGGGGKLKHVGGFGLVNEKKFLDGLDSSGALQESNFVS